MAVSSGLIVEAGFEFSKNSPPPPLHVLVSKYAKPGKCLAEYSQSSAVSLLAEHKCSHKIQRLLERQNRALELIAGIEADSDEDMIAKLEIWRAEVSAEGDECDFTVADKLVLSVLEALKQRI